MINRISKIAFCMGYLALFCMKASVMDMYSFDVGAGGFTVFVKNNRALVVDCGSHESSSYNENRDFKAFIGSVLRNVDHIKIVITHKHVDHYSMLKSMFLDSSRGIVCSRDAVKGVLFCVNSKIQNGEVQNGALPVNLGDCSGILCVSNIHNVLVEINGELYNSGFVVQNFLSDALFESSDAGRVIAYMEDNNFAPRCVTKDSCECAIHDINLVIKVVCCTSHNCYQAVLLPGDASALLLNDLITLYDDFFDHVRFGFLPHHGSTAEGQECLIPHYKRLGIVAIIPSFPQSNWNLPSNISHFLSDNRWNLDQCWYHVFQHTVYHYSHIAQIQPTLTQVPIFTTSGANNSRSLNCIQCSFYNISNLLCYIPSNVIGYVSVLRDYEHMYETFSNTCEYSNEQIIFLNNLVSDFLTIMQKWNGTQDGIGEVFYRVFLQQLQQENNAVYVEQRCVLSPIEDEDIAEAEDVRDIALHNECCLLL